MLWGLNQKSKIPLLPGFCGVSITMTNKEIVSRWQKIADLLSANRLKEALEQLDPMISEAALGEWKSRKEELDTTYKFMLKYTMEGVQDPERQKVYSKLVTRI